jgi:uncharacterized protein YoaH (UPF0181 family)
VAIPVFTSRPTSAKPDDVVSKQIAELQAAVTSNTEAVRVLATELKDTIQGIDSGAARFERELTMLRRLALVSLILAALALATAVWALTH